MRIALVVLCAIVTLLAGVVHSEPVAPVIRVSSYPLTKWITVEAPANAPGVAVNTSSTAVGWVTQAGQRSYSYALVDENNAISPWSPPATFDMLKRQSVIINYDDFVPANPDAIAIIWKTSTGPIAASPMMSHNGAAWGSGDPFRFDPLCIGRYANFQEDWYPYYHHNFPASTIITAQPPVPKIDRYDVPCISFEVAYCEVSHSGETALSPLRLSATGVQEPDSATYREIVWWNCPTSYGSLGRHVYARPVGTTTWYRQPAPSYFPQAGVAMTPDDYLWRLGGQSKQYWYHYKTDLVHTPVAEPKSEICNLLQARMDVLSQGRVILVDVDEVKTRTPIYDRYGPANLEQNLQVMGEWGQKWKLTQDTTPPAGCVNQGTSWPLLLLSNQKSKWRDATAIASNSWAALAYLEWSGGQCFGNEFHSCQFSGKERGVSMTYESGAAGHTPSEQLFKGCFFTGKVGIEVTGNQTANIVFDGPTYVFGGNSTVRGTAAFVLDTPNPVRFKGDTYFDNGFKAIEQGLTTYGNTQFEYVWCDQGHPIFFDNVGRVIQQFTIKGGKLNSWNLWAGKRPFLLRSPCTSAATKFNAENVQMQHNFGVEKHLKVYSQLYQNFQARFTASEQLYNGVRLIEPTWQQQVDLGFKLPQFGSYINGVWTWSQPPMPKISKNINVE